MEMCPTTDGSMLMWLVNMLGAEYKTIFSDLFAIDASGLSIPLQLICYLDMFVIVKWDNEQDLSKLEQAFLDKCDNGSEA